VASKAGGPTVAQGTTAQAGTYTVTIPPGDGYTVTFTKPGFIPVTYHSVSVASNATTHLEPILQIDTAYGGAGSASGIIVNTVSGVGVPGLPVRLREGINARVGTVVAAVNTGTSGFYQFTSLPAGTYTAEVSGTGYITTYFTVLCIGGRNTPNQNAAITPVVPAGELRIVLTWGSSPRDLDSHLTGPLPDGTRFHMYYPYAGAGGPWPTYVTLDVDDVSSYGPETTTIRQQIPGLYRYSVHDYTNRLSGTSTALSNSGAQVRVYSSAGLIGFFNVPANQGGTVWTVFEMNDGQITPVNALSFVSNPGSVSRNDAIDWLDLPPKP
jgi:hypothetical protein